MIEENMQGRLHGSGDHLERLEHIRPYVARLTTSEILEQLTFNVVVEGARNSDLVFIEAALDELRKRANEP